MSAPRDQLPPEYGPRHRDYDIALAVASTTERYGIWIGILASAALWRFGWFVAIPAGYLAMYLVERPSKRAHDAAWEARAAEFQSWSDDPDYH